jgi:hypothetical protein
MSYKEFPPLQAPESYNLSQILEEMQKFGHPSDQDAIARDPTRRAGCGFMTWELVRAASATLVAVLWMPA